MIEKYFHKILKEDISSDANEDHFDIDSDLGDSNSEEEAFQNNLDKDTDPSQYDVNPVSFQRVTQENVEKAREWSKKFEEIANLINDDSDDTTESFNQFINRVDREGSPFQGIVRSQSKRVTRVAEELTSLVEHLNSHIIGSERKMKQLMQQFPNLER